MFVGHALLAFAAVAWLAARRTSPRRALTAGVVAAGFAAVPDVDIGYALVGLAGSVGDAPVGMAASFWATGNVVHRSVTHSLVLAPVVALTAAAWTDDRRGGRALAAALAGALVVVGYLASGPLAALVVVAFAVTSLAVASAVARRTDLSTRATFLLALVGLASHPFGDLFTGEPPRMLYPLGVRLVTERVTLSPDPTLHLLAAFGVELATVWAAALVWSRLAAAARGVERETEGASARAWRSRVDLRAVAGAGYAASVLVIPAPTLDLSYPFVFSVLAVGAVGLLPRIQVRTRQVRRPDAERALFTGLAAVTLAAGAYTVAYLAGVA
ncbi:metal-dependent hydrolase [Candidatus Halobonum tyrrellensis]|uniref:Membrane-bound metal-dependent hydrolase n=1 Tax=Candidatus Halobonum tyrrellensis G22 TaxID=1324957 RepID=V4IVD4_9EURY|nr:metal-dependent hydrolase [Candidatus Halobonum tyrrellensis]ESP87162.1 membrane-bound metal-dependent hydrolase [Candidatus Halobonum tyrrellensis G22]